MIVHFDILLIAKYTLIGISLISIGYLIGITTKIKSEMEFYHSHFQKCVDELFKNIQRIDSKIFEITDVNKDKK